MKETSECERQGRKNKVQPNKLYPLESLMLLQYIIMGVFRYQNAITRVYQHKSVLQLFFEGRLS